MSSSRTIYCFLIAIVFGCSLSGQEKNYFKDHMTLDGYIKYMHTAIIPASGTDLLPGFEDSEDLITDNFLHNRLNYSWYMSDSWSLKSSMRNRFFWGELVRLVNDQYTILADDPGFFDFSILWTSGDSHALHTIFDRLYFTYQKDNLEVNLGRHRINWSMTLIWNPNDIFNSYSFFDFDYEERPGSDAVQIRYYTSPVSQIGLAYQFADTFKESSIAARYQFNTNNYDIQFLGGYQRQYYTLGLGWAGDIRGAGFRGEGTYFIAESALDEENQFVGSFDIDYSFPKGLSLQFSYLFNSLGINASSGDYAAFFLDRSLTAQTLSPAKHNLFFQATGPLIPIIQLSLASIVNPADGSFFIGPSFDWSVVENFDILLNTQFFIGDTMTLYGDGGSYIFLRTKYSF